MSDTSPTPDETHRGPNAAEDGNAAEDRPDPPSPTQPAPTGPTWWSWPQRLLLVTLAVAPTPFCFVFACHAGPSWQSGNLSDYAELLLSWRPSLPFFPFLLYCMVSFTLVVVKPERFLRRATLRLGVYTGVLLALQYLCLVSASFGADYAAISLFAMAICVAAIVLIEPLRRHCGEEAAGCAVALVLILLCVPPVCFLVLVFAPSLTLTVFAAAAIRIVVYRKSDRFQFSLAWLLGVVAWFAAYLGAWRWSVLIMLEEYAKLPTEAPHDCYVATAAARGHRRCVRAERCATAAGQVFLANDQMRRLKAFELILARLCPRAHRACRGVYDRLGPTLASLLIHPLLADVAYFALKPAEWTARATLRLALPRGANPVDRLYR